MDRGVSDGQGDGAAKKPPSKAEAVKVASQYLRTFVADKIGNGRANFSEDAAAVLKFHGSYQQDDRDVRSVMKREGREKAYQLMVRVRMPGGKLATTAQDLTVANVAETSGNGTLRITTLQEFQVHSGEPAGPLARRVPETP
jgi:sulfite reductase (ferredoxin)